MKCKVEQSKVKVGREKEREKRIMQTANTHRKKTNRS